MVELNLSTSKPHGTAVSACLGVLEAKWTKHQ